MILCRLRGHDLVQGHRTDVTSSPGHIVARPGDYFTIHVTVTEHPFLRCSRCGLIESDETPVRTLLRRALRRLRDNNLEAVPGTCPSSGEYVNLDHRGFCPTCGQEVGTVVGVNGVRCWDWHEER